MGNLNKMDRVNKILSNKKYNNYLEKNYFYEKDREFCKHDMIHFLDMARISYIMCLEEGINIDKEIIYAVGLLHDIGRWLEYENKTPHNISSYNLSEEILRECGFLEDEIKIILDGILNHRNKECSDLNKIFYRADKISRKCFSCKASSKCYWGEEKKNKGIIY